MRLEHAPTARVGTEDVSSEGTVRVVLELGVVDAAVDAALSPSLPARLSRRALSVVTYLQLRATSLAPALCGNEHLPGVGTALGAGGIEVRFVSLVPLPPTAAMTGVTRVALHSRYLLPSLPSCYRSLLPPRTRRVRRSRPWHLPVLTPSHGAPGWPSSARRCLQHAPNSSYVPAAAFCNGRRFLTLCVFCCARRRSGVTV